MRKTWLCVSGSRGDDNNRGVDKRSAWLVGSVVSAKGRDVICVKLRSKKRKERVEGESLSTTKVGHFKRRSSFLRLSIGTWTEPTLSTILQHCRKYPCGSLQQREVPPKLGRDAPATQGKHRQLKVLSEPKRTKSRQGRQGRQEIPKGKEKVVSDQS